MTDPIADMLCRIRNAQAAKKPYVLIPFSKFKSEIAKILEKEAFVKEVKEVKKGDTPKKDIKIFLKYTQNGEPQIRGLKRKSKPGQRIYCSKDSIPRVLQGQGVVIISTSSGLLTDREARKRKIGGEVICEVW